jgi:hypothetical protein
MLEAPPFRAGSVHSRTVQTCKLGIPPGSQETKIFLPEEDKGLNKAIDLFGPKLRCRSLFLYFSSAY